MAKSKLVEVNEKIAENVVGGFNKIADKFVDNFLTKEGESVEDAKERLAAEQKERLAQQKSIVEKNMQKAENAATEARRKAGIE